MIIIDLQEQTKKPAIGAESELASRRNQHVRRDVNWLVQTRQASGSAAPIGDKLGAVLI